jgi:hypothetical protein
MQCATLALLRGPSRLAALLNVNALLHVGLNIYHAKQRADIAWLHGRGLAACAQWHVVLTYDGVDAKCCVASWSDACAVLGCGTRILMVLTRPACNERYLAW